MTNIDEQTNFKSQKRMDMLKKRTRQLRLQILWRTVKIAADYFQRL